MKHQVQIGQFKTHCLALLADVNRTKIPLVITKNNAPLVKIVPFTEQVKPFFGCLQGTVEGMGDLIAPIDEVWDAEP